MECPACKKPLSQKTVLKGAPDPATGEVPAQIASKLQGSPIKGHLVKRK